MPAHFTHIYTARRVADYLASGNVPDWTGSAAQGNPIFTGTVGKYGPQYCGAVMKRWEKFTATGAIGPDLFYFSQDYASKVLGTVVPPSDKIMLALAVYYFYKTNQEQDWEPMLLILDGVNSTLGALVRFLLQLEKIWKEFVAVWASTIGPFVDAANSALDDLTGGVVSAFGDGITQLKNAIVNIGELELLSFADIFSAFDTCVSKGWDEQSFLWGDITHYRRTTTVVANLIAQAEALRANSNDQFEQLLAFALGWMTHVGLDTIGHSFVNEQCGGPFRNHPQRHHLIENHIDAWNYRRCGAGGTIPQDPWGATATYPDITGSALAYCVQMTTDNPHGDQRPDSLPTDPKAASDLLKVVDGDMPMWMAEAIVQALKQTFGDKSPKEDNSGRRPYTHPRVYKGDAFQQSIDAGLLTQVFQWVTGHGLDQPFQQLLNDIAPPSKIGVPEGFPLPWQVQTFYRLMITFYSLSYDSSWSLAKPRRPDVIITPPSSDVSNLLSPPDFQGPSSSDPLEDVCDALKSLFDWITKELDAAQKLVGDLVKMLASPGSYPIRLALYELAMLVWDVVQKTHEILTHLGFFVPHGQLNYPDGELMLGDEIDESLITLGRTVDDTFLQALGDAVDPFGNLDRTVPPPLHETCGPNYPYYSAALYDSTNAIPQAGKTPPYNVDTRDYKRPWAYPDLTPVLTAEGKDKAGNLRGNHPERQAYEGQDEDHWLPNSAAVIPGPFPKGSTPDDVFFRTDTPVNTSVRNAYEQSPSPAETDRLNIANIHPDKTTSSPLGDPIPFTAYLIGRILNDRSYSTQFNLDSDRAFGYLTWDWARRTDAISQEDLEFPFLPPQVWPQMAVGWLANPPTSNNAGMRLLYVDKPHAPVPAPPPRTTAEVRATRQPPQTKTKKTARTARRGK